MSRTRQEQETIIRWDRESPDAVLYTASPVEFRKWKRRGYAVECLNGGWRAKVPIRAVSLRSLAAVGRKRQRKAVTA